MAAEADGRVRLAHAETNDKATLKRFADGQVAVDARVVTDGGVVSRSFRTFSFG